ncbi:unnamed protein product, partial [Musa acuminata var. zebrina]
MGGKASSVGWSLHCHGSTNMPCGKYKDCCKCYQLFITLNIHQMSSCSCLIQQKEVYPSVIQWKEGDRAQMIPTVGFNNTECEWLCDIYNIASCTEHTEASIIVFGYTQVSPPKRFQPV